MESKQTPPPPAVTAAAAAGDINTANARADLRLLRGLCVHVLQPIVAKAQATRILRDAAPHLEALEREEGCDEEDAANARENTADADALAMLPGFFTALERASSTANNGTASSSSAAASSSSTATSARLHLPVPSLSVPEAHCREIRYRKAHIHPLSFRRKPAGIQVAGRAVPGRPGVRRIDSDAAAATANLKLICRRRGRARCP